MECLDLDKYLEPSEAAAVEDVASDATRFLEDFSIRLVEDAEELFWESVKKDWSWIGTSGLDCADGGGSFSCRSFTPRSDD